MAKKREIPGTRPTNTPPGEVIISLRRDYEDDYNAMEKVLDLLGQVTEKETVDDICRTIVEGVRNLLGFDRAGLFLWDSVNGCFRGTFGTDTDGGTIDEHDLFWAAEGWPSSKLIERGDIFIEEVLDQPPPQPGEEGIKAYMVVLRFGEKVHGILSVDNRISRRRVLKRELEYLTLFSRIVGNAVDISRYRAQLQKNNDQFQRELKLAQSVQIGFLPKKFPREDCFVFGKTYNTCEMLGGDLYDVVEVSSEQVGIYMADVAGHGVSAALISGVLKMAFSSLRGHHGHLSGFSDMILLRPQEVLKELNNMLCEEIPEDEFITMLYALYDVPSMTFKLASAGHLSPLQYHAEEDRVTAWPIATGPPLGVFPDREYPVIEQSVKSGDKVLFFTDGLTEVMNDQEEEFGEVGLLGILKKNGRRSPEEIIRAVGEAFTEFRGACPLNDDWTLLVVEIR